MNPFFLVIVEIIYRPIFNLLLLFLVIFNLNLGVAIIILTLFVRLLLLKPTLAGNKMQKEMTDLQPKLKEIQEKYKNDQQKMAEETMSVFKKHGSGPLKGCLMLLVQIPVFIGLFFVIRNFSETEGKLDMTYLYSFLEFINVRGVDISQVNTVFFGIDLLSSGSIALTIIAPLLLFLQMKLTMLNRPSMPTNMPGAENMPDMTKMMGYMNIALSTMMAFFVYTMPAGIGLYIATTTLFGVIQFSIQYRQLIKAKLMSLKGGSQT
ncbi:YidC/Oxa1 family membrane protein insertase [Candidatus Absconditicoccus praedator]|uniref:YidC/Oxa1 family membrane protein insertase n=1 Tax=Candidatus Absconditicoccus praedator TaxID=2735562 RepID=UPI001E35C9AC|nr:YidC/Oxa1 family membrane protein insertase [Candidatus Absconditicoccus praedator]UFX83209.1 membrane protein insertase YidC [Candidatus Absconditicoccus praedator]